MAQRPPGLARRCAAEFIGTFGLLFAGAGAIMVDDISGGAVTNLGIGIVFGLAVAAMIFATGHISGAHINPAVTIGFAVARHFPWRIVPLYWAMQLLGAAAACLVLRGLLGDVADMGGTVPMAELAPWAAVAFEGLLAFFLMFVIMAMATDVRAVGAAAALAIGGMVALESTFGGPITGASMNPARSFGPALVGGAWTAHWAYWVGPIAGAAAAAVTYAWLREGHQST